MSPFRVIEWRDRQVPSSQIDIYEREFNLAVDRLFASYDPKPVYSVCDLSAAENFRQFVIAECEEHKSDGAALGIICHGDARGLMASTHASAEGVLDYPSFWGAIEEGLGCFHNHVVLFASCDALAHAKTHTGLAPNCVDTIIGYSGKPRWQHAVKLLAGVFALDPQGFVAAQLAMEDGGEDQRRLAENFKLLDEFFEVQAISPNKNPGYLPDPDDPDEGEIQFVHRAWQPVRSLKLI